MRAALILALLLPATLSAQSTQSDLEARLVHKELYLRGLWSDGKLRFNSDGQLQSKSKTTTFTLAGAEIKSVELKPDHLQLEGIRFGIHFDETGTHFIDMDDLHIRIDGTRGSDYTQAIDTVFSTLPGLIPILPSIWRPYAEQHFTHGASNSAADDPPKPAKPPFDRTGVTPPRVLSAPSPEFSPAAKAKRIGGSVLVYLEADSTGHPRNIRILRPLGMGLDEQAASAVSQYKFRPAMRAGTPIAVEMNVVVNFQFN